MKKFLKNALSAIAGFLLLAVGYFILGQILGLIFGSSSPPSIPPTEPAAIATAAPTEPLPTREVVGYLPDDTPVYADQIYVPKPFFFDSHGVKYVLEEGTIDEYYIDEDYQEVVETPDSTAFTEILYRPYSETLRVVFRNSGDSYVYYDVDYDVWLQFTAADSKGKFFNEYIKDQYEYDLD